ncbi:MAG: acetyltransferase [Burkholderiales bacterium]|nr:acetyltransferase [Burkholderiales bacterium]
MAHYDVFNGDADGIASIVQLRLARPIDSVLVTGSKRDIRLLDRVEPQPGDTITVLDIALDANRAALERVVAGGARVEYFDHHYAGALPLPPGVVAHLDPAPGVCTGMLVDRHLGGRQRIWAVVAAFGDNLVDAAHGLAAPLTLGPGALDALHTLGDCLTFNTYADDLDDAIVRPDDLVRILLRHADPLRFVATDPMYAQIDEARRRDLALARATPPAHTLPGARVYVLPDAPWTRRVRGIFGNEVANANPGLAHAVVTTGRDGTLSVSVRAPRARPTGAHALCRDFAGGGREAAAGIDRLPAAELPAVIASLARAYPAPVS